MRVVLAVVLGLAGCTFDRSGTGTAGTGEDAGGPGDPDASSADANASTDSDGDGIPDATDNCVSVSNAAQRDEDGDEVGDVCDNCPHVANADQANLMEAMLGNPTDGIGDACDPRPGGGGDQMVRFDGFNGPLAAGWNIDSGTWATDNGSLVQSNAGGGLQVIYWSGERVADVVIDTAIVYTVIPGGSAQNSFRSGGAMASFEPSNGGTGYECGQNLDVSDNSPSVLMVSRYANGAALLLDQPSCEVLTTGVVYQFRFEATTSANDLRCTLSGGDSQIATASDGTHGEGFAGLRTFGVQARYPYIVIYSLGQAGQ